LVREPGLHLAETLVGESGGADHGMDSVVDQELQVVHHDVWVREVDDNLGLAVGEEAQRIAGVDPRREREVVCRLDGLNHGGADLALGTENSDSHGPTLASARLWITVCTWAVTQTSVRLLGFSWAPLCWSGLVFVVAQRHQWFAGEMKDAH